MLNFCTLFDSNYLSRGLVTYESLINVTSGNVHLYVIAFDDKCFEVLTNMSLPHLTVISLSDFEDEALLAVKSTRTRGEYCWTCTSSTIAYCIEKYQLPHCIYIDADMFFYADPQVLVDEMPADKHVMITEHRYTPQYDKSKLSGKYCVQFMYFDNSEAGLEVLNWWRARCLEWCFNRHEDGKFGDQKYLDDWAERFSCVHELQHLGGGLAPWNIQRFDYHQVKNGFSLVLKNAKDLNEKGNYTEGGDVEPIFFHFHGVKLYENGGAIYAPKMYILNKNTRQLFYEPYLQKLQLAQQKLYSFDIDFEKLGISSAKQYAQDRTKGWGAFVKTNLLNKFLGTKL
jgi:hypothetical protein